MNNMVGSYNFFLFGFGQIDLDLALIYIFLNKRPILGNAENPLSSRRISSNI